MAPRLVVPACMRNDILDKIHEGHQGLVKCEEHARPAVWWPGLSDQIREFVTDCRVCIKERTKAREPLLPSTLPDRPWQKLGADLFTLKGKTYLLVVDRFSRFVEMAQLNPTRSTDVITHLKSMMARRGICEVRVSDNCLVCWTWMAQFAAKYGFKRVTSSPRYPQSNAEAERAVQSVKILLTKAKDPYRALLATPLSNGYSPAQLLIGRHLRTTLPILPERLQPAVPALQAHQQKDTERRRMDIHNYNSRHRARDLPLAPGEEVWITAAKTQGTVTSKHQSPRSYLVEGPQGLLRRNLNHLVSMPTAENQGNDQEKHPSDQDSRSPAKTLRAPQIL
uniref:Gypsy retrotransposon integrase-like protein 1 n=1 Tax=Nothobranchius furzeri TaxID=105023 RepID=A0A8C6LLM9_NOTFU